MRLNHGIINVRYNERHLNCVRYNYTQASYIHICTIYNTKEYYAKSVSFFVCCR